MSSPGETSIKAKAAPAPRPWYKEPWLWLVLAPLLLVVGVSSITVSIAVRNADDVVKDNYYRDGRMIYHDDAAEKAARELHLQSDLNFDWQAGRVLINLNQLPAAPSLELLLIHPAEAEHDIALTLQPDPAAKQPAMFFAELQRPVHDRWSLRLLARAGELELWRLDGKIDFSQSTRIHLE